MAITTRHAFFTAVASHAAIAARAAASVMTLFVGKSTFTFVHHCSLFTFWHPGCRNATMHVLHGDDKDETRMTLRIYGAPRSRTFRVLWAAEELGIPYENIPVDFGDGSKKADYLAINPNGRIPAIDDGGFVLFESLAINMYLAKKHGAGTLYPAAAQDEARLWQWSLWGANEIEVALVQFISNRYVLPPEKRNEPLAAEAEAKLPRPLGVLDAHLATRAHLLGGDFTIADLNVGSLLYTAWINKADLSRWPRVKGWLDRLLTRPAALRARKMRES
jgi:glutathione S-transferase